MKKGDRRYFLIVKAVQCEDWLRVDMFFLIGDEFGTECTRAEG